MAKYYNAQYKAPMKMRLTSLLALFFVNVVLLGSTLASDIKTHPVAVVELFTSQGCSSCPPADALITELDQRSDILALAYHVDYWDYIGWKDSFGDPAFSDLQRAYAQSWGKNRIYTPQLVINGTHDFVGSHREAVLEGIAQAHLPVSVELSYRDGFLDVGINGAMGNSESVVYLVTFREQAEVQIERGENRGKSIAYTQIVTSRQIIGTWNPLSGNNLRLPLNELLGEDSDGVVILVQEQLNGLPGPILGASLFQM